LRFFSRRHSSVAISFPPQCRGGAICGELVQ
jgi:hypothetical protein